MIEIKNVDAYGWQAAIRGMRNSWNSCENSDSRFRICTMPGKITYAEIGQNDLALTKKLAAAGSDERKFMRMITVTADVVAPLYWRSEYDTYKIGTVANSCSKMHTIADKEFTLDDFSHEHLFDDAEQGTEFLREFKYTTAALNAARKRFLQTIQLLPSSYNQRRTVQLNYEALLKIYRARKNHKLDEWRTFCSWIETLPYMSEFLGGE